MLFHVIFDEYEYKLFKVNDLKDCLLNILQIVLLKQKGLLSMSLLEGDDEKEYSIIMRDDLCNGIVSASSCHDLYKMIKIEASSNYGGLNESGILSEITKKFAKYEIPILCMSSFANNCILYPVPFHDKVKELIANSIDFSC